MTYLKNLMTDARVKGEMNTILDRALHDALYDAIYGQ